MYQLLALINGIIIAVMISINGSLSVQYSAFRAAVIIHAVGSLFALLLCGLGKNKRLLWKHKPKWMYLGGAIGVFTTVFQNIAFGYISIISVIALGLLGQTATALVIDGFGLFGMEKRSMKRYTLIGFVISVFGIFMMLDTTVISATIAVGISFASGVTMVLSRMVNARLAEKTGALHGSLVNHLVGLLITVVIAFAVTKENFFTVSTNDRFQPWIYLGGVLGVIVIMLLNITVPKISAFRLTLFVFVGQIFAGIFLDVLSGNRYSGTSFVGGIIIAIGITANMILERVDEVKNRKHQEYLARIKKVEEKYHKYLLEQYNKSNG